MAQLWSLVCLAGLWGVVGCSVGFILNVFPARGAFNRSASLKWGGALLFCFISWIVGMSNA